ncbi:peptidoglycan-binding protein [Sorangium sp. So ce233]|uniref:peptidoglycan-binding protein n=1 Tax=Sorangium sp. So ce233 TaxID=3133290 RepID=UPI003F6004B9
MDEIWNHPSNEELRRRRLTPDILHPGDILYLPGVSEGRDPLPLTIGGENRFTARVPTVEIRLILRRADGTALAGERFRVDGSGPEPFTGTTTGDGLALFRVPSHVREVRLSLQQEGLRYQVRIGQMDPRDELSGAAKRLAHLGYLPVLDFPAVALSEDVLHEAIAAFQEAQGDLQVTGTLDDATRDALVAAHGS